MAPKRQVERNRYGLRFHENRYAKNAEPVPLNRFVNRFLAVQAEPVRIGSTHWMKLLWPRTIPVDRRRDADAIGTHLLNCVAIAVQRCTGMSLRASVEREMVLTTGAQAA